MLDAQLVTSNHDRFGDGDVPCGTCVDVTGGIDAGVGITMDDCAAPPPSFCRLFDPFFERAPAI